MSQIFVFTAGDSGARSHLGESIVQSIDVSVAVDVVGEASREVFEPIFQREGGLWAWGSIPTDRNRTFWKQMAVGDWVLCVYENTYHYVARVALTLENDDLARRTWGDTREGSTWSLMYFLTRPIKISKPVAELAEFLNSGYRGFTRIGADRVAKIEQTFGSVDRFVENRLISNVEVQSDRFAPTSPPRYFLIRSNEDSEYGDEIGARYHFTSNVPNWKALVAGGSVVVDRKSAGGAVIIGYGDLGPAETKEEDDRTHFISAFTNWMPVAARPLTPSQRAAIQALPSYNVQHAVRPITREVYEMLIAAKTPSAPLRIDIRDAADSLVAAIHESGVSFGGQHDNLVRAFLASLVAKPLAILTGLSGSGKTQLALRTGEWLGGSFFTAAVRPDWTGAEALFGYEDALKPMVDGRPSWVVPQTLEFMLRARDHQEEVHLLILDEMNLAHVERYFADALSGMESQQPCLPNLFEDEPGLWKVRRGSPELLSIPTNLWVVGTVNVDETTYMFSPKVLDRSNTFEFRVSTSDLASTDGKKPRQCRAGDSALVRGLLAVSRDADWHRDNPPSFAADLSQRLVELHAVLAQYGYEFGHRTYYESLRFAAVAERAGVGGLTPIFDRIVMQKVLPRLHGARRRLEVPLLALLQFCSELPTVVAGANELSRLTLDDRLETAVLPLSYEKARRMLRSLRANQFVSFTE